MAPRAPITHFELDSDRRAVIADCIDNYEIGDASAEWPNNILSRRTVVYGSGRIAKTDEKVSHAVDPDELELCRRLSAEAANLVAGTEVGMGSESGDEFKAFFIAGNVGESVPDAIDAAMILERFGGTIFPLVKITVEPLAEQGVWWSEVEYDGADDLYVAPWKRMIGWFKGRPEFVNAAFVRIGSEDDLLKEPKEQWPNGTEMIGSVLPRLAVGLTRGGSLVGLFGCCVQT